VQNLVALCHTMLAYVGISEIWGAVVPLPEVAGHVGPQKHTSSLDGLLCQHDDSAILISHFCPSVHPSVRPSRIV